VDQQPFEEITPERLDTMNRINVNGSIWCARGTEDDAEARDGRSSTRLQVGQDRVAIMAAYSGAKGAIISITHAMAFELAKDNIKVNCLCPASSRTRACGAR